jgi:chaperone required for assembly of F1-ATPase
MAVAAPLQSAFKLELDWRISWLTDANLRERNKARILRRILIESFINALHHGATLMNIITQFRATDIMSFNPEIPL